MSNLVNREVEVIKLGVALGAEIRGVDIALGTTQDQMRQVIDALHENGVVVLRDQAITPSQQVNFCGLLGPMRVSFMTNVAVPEVPELTVVSNIVENGRAIGLVDAGALWHTDGSYLPNPDMYTVLHAITIPRKNDESLGDTCFLSTAAVYEALPSQIRERIDGARGIHSLTYHIQRKVESGFKAPPAKEPKPDVFHPAVIAHPATGRKGIYLTEGHTKGIEGMSNEEGRELLDFIAEFARQPQFIYRHKWREGDLLIWDNLGTQHLAITDYGDLPRKLHRAGISSPFPVFHGEST